MNDKKISIIIPVYNNFGNPSQLLNNLKKQTLMLPLLTKEEARERSCVEIIIVDDCSDNPLKQSDLKTDLDVKVIRHEKNMGAPAARNTGFKNSSGKYIFFCDADILFIKKDALQKMIDKLEQNLDKAYCYCDFTYGWKIMRASKFNLDKLRKINYISTMSLIRRSALEKVEFNGPWDENLKKFQDWDLWLTMLENNLTGIYLPEILWRSCVSGFHSSWFPKIFYKIPFFSKKMQSIKDYEKWKNVIQEKHSLT